MSKAPSDRGQTSRHSSSLHQLTRPYPPPPILSSSQGGVASLERMHNYDTQKETGSGSKAPQPQMKTPKGAKGKRVFSTLTPVRHSSVISPRPARSRPDCAPLCVVETSDLQLCVLKK